MILNPYAIVIDAYATLVGKKPGSSSYADHKAYINANGQASYVSALESIFSNTTNASMATTVLGNLGLSNVFTAAEGEAYFAANAGARVQAALNLASLLSNYAGSDAAILAAKTAYTNTTANAYAYASNTANTTDAASSAEAVSSGQTFTLTTSVDSLTGTGVDDVFVADNTANSELTAADTLNGGAGVDTLKIYADGTPSFTIGEGVTNIENLYVNGELKAAFNVANNGFQSVEVDTVATTGTADHVITVAAGMTVILDSVTDGDLAADGAASGGIQFTGATSVSSLALVVDGVGASTVASANDDLDLDITSASITSVSIASQGTVSTDKNYVGLKNAGGKLDTLTITGDKLLDAREDAVTTLKTINASASTGGVVLNVTGSTLDVAFTGGTGNDTLIVGADLDTYDVINGGDGTDTVVISDATLTSKTLAAVKGANAMTNVEVLGVSATATMTIDASIFTGINTFSNTAAATGTAGSAGSADGNGKDGVNLTFQNGDAFTIGKTLTGGAGAASAGEAAGGDALEVAAKVNSGTDVITITLNAGAATTLTGGAGDDAGSAADDGTGGHAINASTVETINIVTASSKDDLTLTGGAAGSGAGAAGSGLSVGANATVNISGAGDVNIGTILTQGASVDDLTINGSGMSGVLTVTTGAGNDIITGGSGADVLAAGTGVNTLTGGAGADQFKFADDDSDGTSSLLTTITDFEMGAGKDVIKFTAAAGVFEVLTSARAAAIAADTSLSDAITEAGAQLADHAATVFVYDGNAYVIYDEASGDFSVVKLAGITDVSGFDATNIA